MFDLFHNLLLDEIPQTCLIIMIVNGLKNCVYGNCYFYYYQLNLKLKYCCNV